MRIRREIMSNLSRPGSQRFTALSGVLLVMLLLSGLLVQAEVKRQHNLDYLDNETLRYYLSAPKEDYDVAVMFYAQWDRNSHNLAPTWGQIAHIKQAGTKESKLILALFDCESNHEHVQTCEEAGVTHYPTLLFLNLAEQKLQRKTPTHGNQFGGNWQYGDAVLDWITAMQGLANWHRAGWGKRLRRMFFGKPKTPEEKALPLGIPHTSNDKILEHQQEELENLVQRSTAIVETLLFPIQDSTGNYVMEEGKKKYTDVFSLLSKNEGWRSEDMSILRTCAMEVSLDYCQRFSSSKAEELARGITDLDSITEYDIEKLQKELLDLISDEEPYCVVIEDCIMSDMASDSCRPDHCPFNEKIACRYLTACLSESIHEEYKQAMIR